MNRTGVFLAAAGVLALVAVVAGLPRQGGQTTTTTAPPGPVVVTAPPAATASDGSLTMLARLSHPFIGLGRQDVFATVELKAREVADAKRTPVNLALVIDRSGSMSGPKLASAKQAARQLVSQLAATDRLTIVHYGSDVKSLEGLVATPENKQRMLTYIDGIWDDGGTNIGAALTTARDLLAVAKSDYQVNRLILVSDGQPTEGLTDTDGLLGLVREARALGISVSSLGVGDDFNETLMGAFAEVGAGAYGYLQDAAQLATIFQKDLAAAGTQVARNVSVTFKVPAGARFEQVLGYSQVTRTTVDGAEYVTVAMPDFHGGQQERVVVHLTVDGVVDGKGVEVSGLELRYTDLLAHGAEVKSEARLSAMTSASQDVVSKSRDKDAVVFAARARAAANAQQAAALADQGDNAGAERLLQQNAVYFDEAQAVAGEAAVKADRVQQQQQVVRLKSVRNADDARQYKKVINSEARKSFGLMDSTY